INTLVGLRAEDERVFEDTHELPLAWLREGSLDGFRVDHVDGLRDPEGYLARLAGLTPRPWLVVEKILQPGERLRESWPVDGSTAYDFMARASGLFVDRGGEEALTRFYAEFTGETTDWAALLREKKDLALREMLGSDVNRLAALLLEICEHHRRHRDYT